MLRMREFLMKDAYTLDPDAAALENSYNAHKDAYREDLRSLRCLASCGRVATPA